MALDDYVLEQDSEYISVAEVLCLLEEYQRKVKYYENGDYITNADIKNYIFSHATPNNDKNSFKAVIRFLNRNKFQEVIQGYCFDDSTGLYKNINEGKSHSFDDLYTYEDILELLKINPNAPIEEENNRKIIEKFIWKYTHISVRKSELIKFQPFIDAQVSGLFNDDIPYVYQDSEILINPKKKDKVPYEEYKKLLSTNEDLCKQVSFLQMHLTFSGIPYKEEADRDETRQEDSEQTLNQDENNREQLLYLNDTLTIDEAACIISGDNPSDIKYALDNEKILSYKNFLNAQRLVQSAIQLGNLSIYRDFGIATFEFKAFLMMKNLIIKGFNDNQIDKDDSMELLAEQMTGQSIYISQLENRIEVYESSPQVNHEQLKLELAQAKELIKQLETKQKDEKLETQTNQDESKLGTREENNIIKVLAVLADMEKKIDISKPYEAHGIMFNKAQLLGIDKFPSNESIKKWFIKANECKKS